MLRRKNTVQILMFVSALIIYIFLFLVITSSANIPCNSDSDCPWKIYYTYRCNDGFCVYKSIDPSTIPQYMTDLIFPR
ncbi:putative Late nodulin [Medicago truncatula]|uniref:Nodule Cysteine-Rich (NCR) secreted peptide n=1 Tax=Medicago truncatula TaxID=3880 RepID=A0A072UVS8_MEDTR|nr:Nodule Cysteine-Rich (NCR) secreted peptide [Medicago truncatula]RHN60639.1 putative Late nodulin [Medicago truncatula]